MTRILIIGCGLAGISAAIRAADQNADVTLLSPSRPDRSQSVLAAGGINAALNTKNEQDSPEEHAEDTIRAGVWLADPAAVRDLTAAAPAIVTGLGQRGIVFSRDADNNPDLRHFGGQKKCEPSSPVLESAASSSQDSPPNSVFAKIRAA